MKFQTKINGTIIDHCINKNQIILISHHPKKGIHIEITNGSIDLNDDELVDTTSEELFKRLAILMK